MQRVATHPYTGEDEDELSFDKGDLILVIPFEVQDEEVLGCLLTHTVNYILNTCQVD